MKEKWWQKIKRWAGAALKMYQGLSLKSQAAIMLALGGTIGDSHVVRWLIGLVL